MAIRNITWKDQLTAYDGNTITYYALGNPISVKRRKPYMDRQKVRFSTTEKTQRV